MDADIKGCYEQLNRSYRAFEHNGKSMTKIQVKKCLEYGLASGMKSVSEIPTEIIESIIKSN
jgi:hypothetical protein